MKKRQSLFLIVLLSVFIFPGFSSCSGSGSKTVNTDAETKKEQPEILSPEMKTTETEPHETESVSEKLKKRQKRRRKST